ncbi:hypothetical protein [Moorena producens]|uniref:hypothetical protein n=1 Tax=Moorena producens TaxID=1155739 RepID=UPI0011EA6A18|nr:hypothetical protein [Moorena producens]
MIIFDAIFPGLARSRLALKKRGVAPLPTPYSLLPTPYSLLPVPLAISDNHWVRIIFPKTYTLSKRQYIHIPEILNIAVEW